MTTPLESLIASGTKLWLDSIDPVLVAENRALGATGATSNPAIISDLIETGRFDDRLKALISEGYDDSHIAWTLTDRLVSDAEGIFSDVHQNTGGNDGYVSFELDPLLEDPEDGPEHSVRVQKYIELGKQWSAGHPNRMIKVPATPAGIAALSDLVAAGITVNVTLIFSDRQYREAREAVWRGAQLRDDLTTFKSVYSIFISRIDVYTQKHVSQLSPAAQGQVGIENARTIWRENQQFWSDKKLPLSQEMIFASTGTKNSDDPPWKYVQALAGSDIQTNPPATNDAVQQSGLAFTRAVDQRADANILAEIDKEVDAQQMETVLMEEGIRKFAEPQKALLSLIADRRNVSAHQDQG